MCITIKSGHGINIFLFAWGIKAVMNSSAFNEQHTLSNLQCCFFLKCHCVWVWVALMCCKQRLDNVIVQHWYSVSSFRPVLNHHDPSNRDRDRDRDSHPLLGAPPPLISPKHQHKDHAPPPPTTLWNPAALIETSTDSRRTLHEPPSLSHYDISRLSLPPSKHERHYNSEKLEEGPRKRDSHDKYPPIRPSGFSEPNTFLAELEKSTQSFLNQQRAPLSLSGPHGELSAGFKPSGPLKSLQGHSRLMPDTTLVYDEFLQQHRRAVSKLDLEERRRREAREKGTERC